MVVLHLPKFNANYCNFRLKDINHPEYRHLWYLIFWPIYIVRYFILSSVNLQSRATLIHCALDDHIPFIEWFVLFYILWYVFIFGMHLWLAFFDKTTYRRYTIFLLISIAISTTTYIVYPSCHNLRPETMERTNICTQILKIIWSVDSPTNIFPSEHVIGALAVMFAALHTDTFHKVTKTITVFLAIMISLSTVFVKQHSVLDIFASVLVCTIVYLICYKIPDKKAVSP